MTMPGTAEPDPLILLTKIDFPQIVLFHQFDQFANAIDVEHIARFFIRLRHDAALSSKIQKVSCTIRQSLYPDGRGSPRTAPRMIAGSHEDRWGWSGILSRVASGPYRSDRDRGGKRRGAWDALTQGLGGDFRKHGIDEAVRAPFEACDLAEPGNDLQSPVKCVRRLLIEWAGLKNEVVGAMRMLGFDGLENRLSDPRKVLDFLGSALVEMGAMMSWNHGHRVWEPRCEGTERDEVA